MSEYPLCTLLVEEGRAAPPVRERCKINPVYGSPIGLHSLATIRFQKKIKWLYWQTSYYNWGYCRI